MRVAVAQVESVAGDLDSNLRKHLDVIAAARARGVEVLLFPELSLAGHAAGRDAVRLAMGRDHRMLADIARASGDMCTVVGIVEEAAAGQFYNAAVALRRDAPPFVHRKINLATYGKLEDGKHFAAGSMVDTLDLDARWRSCVMICADTWNPPLVHLAACRHATLLLVAVSSALEAVGEAFDNPQGWDTNLRFHATTYGMPVMMANRVGTEGDLTFWGGSRVLDPFGRVIAKAEGTGEALVEATLDYEDVRRARYLLPTVRDANLPLLAREIARIIEGCP